MLRCGRSRRPSWTTTSFWRSDAMATPEAVAEKRELAGINADSKEKFVFYDSESGYAYQAAKGLSRGVAGPTPEYNGESPSTGGLALKPLEHFYSRPSWSGR